MMGVKLVEMSQLLDGHGDCAKNVKPTKEKTNVISVFISKNWGKNTEI
jgi:hypothetical protein